MARKRKSSDGFNEKDYPGATGGPAGARKRYVGVRQRPSGRWVAEIKDTIQKIRVWLGTFDTAEAAARAYDEAACLLRGSNTRTNFWPCSPANPSARPALPSKVSDLLLLQLKARREAQQQSQQHQEDEDIEQFQFSEFLNDLSVCEGAEQRRGEEEGVFDVGAMDLRFVDAGEDQCCFYSPFEIAEEIVEPMEQETVVADEHLMLKRMKYERKISASLYAINGISECLKIRFGGNRGVDHCNVSNLRRACERQGVEEEEMVGGEDGEGVQVQVENPQNPDPCLPSLSSTTSPSSSSRTLNSEGELSLWSSLDLPPICFVS